MIHGDLIGERARLTPEKLALVDVATGSRLTYAQLDERAVVCARALRETLGLRKGDRVGILAANRVEYLDLFFAAGKSGLVIVPLGTRLTSRELGHIASDSGLRVLVYEEEFSDRLASLRASTSIDSWVALETPAVAEDWSFAALRASVQPGSWSRERCGPEDLYALLYTRGTTGRPKGVMIPHRMVAWNAYNTVACWQLRDDDVSPIFTPLYHAGGLGVFLTPMVVIGGTIVLFRSFDAGDVWRTIARERCTVVLGVPTIWKLMMEAPEFATTDVSRVRWFISGGAPLPEYIAHAYQQRGIGFKQGYGLTEVGVNCFSMTLEDSVRKRGSIGRPFMMTEARLVDGRGEDVAPGAVGELWLRGPHVTSGYWRDAEATAAALDAAGWFHTGDLARCDGDGFYYVAGRQKDMFISGGVNVYPAEIEGELLLHAEVADAAVVGVPHDRWGEVGIAFVVPRNREACTREVLRAHLESRLARFKHPKTFVFVDALPRTAYGKVQKSLLLERFLALEAEGAAAVRVPDGRVTEERT
jgi:fatty-acyl-CoA synthase